MKTTSKIYLLVIALFLVLFVWFINEKVAVNKLVNERCNQFPVGDNWVGCVIDLAVEKEDAKYCRSVSFLSPYPGICMEGFAQKTSGVESCQTITKPRPKEDCLSRFR